MNEPGRDTVLTTAVRLPAGMLVVETQLAWAPATEPEPDPDWSWVDPAGHAHAWGSRSTHEVVTGQHQGPDGELVTDRELRCADCDALVVPGVRVPAGLRYRAGPRRIFLDGQPISEQEYAVICPVVVTDGRYPAEPG